MRRYLVVDDNRVFGENLAEILADEGDAQVDLVLGGPPAIERVSQQRYDAVLTDMRMPVMSGAELVHRIRRIDPGIPAIVVTAYTGDDDLDAARREGLLAVLPKPTPIPELLGLLAVARRHGLVVVVEDDASLADNLSETLRARGFTAVCAASVLETTHLGDVHPFAALADLRVPGGPDGLAVTRLGERFPGIPVVVMTAHDLDPPVPHVAVFRKPFATSEVMALLERLHVARDA